MTIPSDAKKFEPKNKPSNTEGGTDLESADSSEVLAENTREEIEKIKAENLTGQQLRIARRLAQKNGIEPISDLDAVRLLRISGIDPFPGAAAPVETTKGKKQQLGTMLPAKRSSTEVDIAEVKLRRERDIQIRKLQMELVKRRRARYRLLLLKLLIFIIAPTTISCWYFSSYATPMYSTYTQYTIQMSAPSSLSASSASAASAATVIQDSILVQAYLTSRAAMLRLNEELGFIDIMKDPGIDALQRIPKNATHETAYGAYKTMVLIGLDPTDGVLKMEVLGPSPELASEFTRELIEYAEETVDNLTLRQREDQLAEADKSFEEAEMKMKEANEKVLQLQQNVGVLSAETEISQIMSMINGFETTVEEKKLELAELMSNPRPNKTKVKAVNAIIERLEAVINKKRQELIDGNDKAVSLARIAGELAAAEAELDLRRGLLATALEQREVTRLEATRQTRYLSIGVPPILPDQASYPKVFENTLLSFIVFTGVFLLVSLTASILREQMST